MSKQRAKYPAKVKEAKRRSVEKKPDWYSRMGSLWSAQYIARTKRLVLSHYSGGSLVCACCGESELDFLTIDHVNNDGAKERMALYGTRRFGGSSVYRTLIKRGFPPGYAVLCMSCNMSKSKHHVCVHQLRRHAFHGVSCYT